MSRLSLSSPKQTVFEHQTPPALKLHRFGLGRLRTLTEIFERLRPETKPQAKLQVKQQDSVEPLCLVDLSGLGFEASKQKIGLSL